MSDKKLNEYLEFAKSLALEAGGIMKKNFLAGVKKEWKADTTPLTATDTAINRLVIEKISQKYPTHSVWGEEEKYNLGNEFTWVCDPVDGTMPFSHGLPLSTFALALVHNGRPVVGVIHDPYLERTFWATKGGGAFLNGERIGVSDKQDLRNALIDLEGFPSSNPVYDIPSEFIGGLNKLGAHTTVLWSGIIPSALVASGQYSAVLYNISKPEEGASAKIIVEEAGGKVTDLHGNEQCYDQKTKGLIISNGSIHEQLVKFVRGYLK